MALLKESRRYRSALTHKMLPLAIDYQAVAYFFKSLKTIPDSEGFTLADAVSIMTQLIIAEWASQASEDSQTSQLMCLRGLLALIHNENFGDYDSQDSSTSILKAIMDVLGKDVSHENRQKITLENASLAVQFLAVMPTKLLHEYVMQLQSLLTISIISGAMLNMELFVETIRVLDILHWVNAKLKEPESQIEKKEFHNDAVNNNLELRSHMVQWANTTKV